MQIQVQQALSEGKPVPPEVLKDYPELTNAKEPLFPSVNKDEQEAMKRVNPALYKLAQKANTADEFVKLVAKSASKSVKDIETKDLLEKVHHLKFQLCGHNIKIFDIPMLGKRFLINGMLPPSILPSYDTKPWEVQAIDTKDVWQFGNNYSISSLDLMCVSMGIESPKTGEVSGNMVHETFWNKNDLDSISKYCDKDVISLVNVIQKLYELK